MPIVERIMPRGGDDLASTDEVKVYKDEGDDENRASQNLSEDKRELVIETEEVWSISYYLYECWCVICSMCSS